MVGGINGVEAAVTVVDVDPVSAAVGGWRAVILRPAKHDGGVGYVLGEGDVFGHRAQRGVQVLPMGCIRDGTGAVDGGSIQAPINPAVVRKVHDPRCIRRSLQEIESVLVRMHIGSSGRRAAAVDVSQILPAARGVSIRAHAAENVDSTEIKVGVGAMGDSSQVHVVGCLLCAAAVGRGRAGYSVNAVRITARAETGGPRRAAIGA